jgi:hypothetical protein
MAGYGLVWLGGCGRWLPVRLPATSLAKLTFERAARRRLPDHESCPSIFRLSEAAAPGSAEEARPESVAATQELARIEHRLVSPGWSITPTALHTFERCPPRPPALSCAPLGRSAYLLNPPWRESLTPVPGERHGLRRTGHIGAIHPGSSRARRRCRPGVRVLEPAGTWR